jgi:hypothetical protein
MDRSIETTSIILHFSHLPGPRKQHNQLYSLHDIINIAILATLCSVDDYYGLWAEDNLEWLQSAGICMVGPPSHDTYEKSKSRVHSKNAFQLYPK